ncbi:hypothetical protein B0J13DRAFT_560401 [Dactylonectria estremocensis]|uniref:F-box domain-containing protein n=1 Tax=Dactylonectria estremocensis TaxID=1079267 RepID=A0A9P9J0H0_9HYPO|nr:hypothetical protein B0J13DRAFT_560401 [Dactylonectria estremocensis]
MGGWDVYCALCGGPLGSVYWEPEEEDVYDPGVLENCDDPELAWLSDIRIIGEDPESESICKVWISGPAFASGYGTMGYEPADPIDPVMSTRGSISVYTMDAGEPWSAPFHTCCREVLCRYMCIPVSRLDKEVLFETLKSMAEDEQSGRCLDLDYGDISEEMGQYWMTSRDTEHFVFNPVEVKGLRELLENLPQITMSPDRVIRTYSLEGDPFARLPPDVLLFVVAHLQKIATIKKLRRASPAFANLELSNSFWRYRLLDDMPWLWDLPSPMTAQQRNETDWQLVYRKLHWGSRPMSKNKNKIHGLCNRKRIWEQMCPDFAEEYQRTEVSLQKLGAATPIALKGAFRQDAAKLIKPVPTEVEQATSSLIERFSELPSALPSVSVDWDGDGKLMDIRITKEHDADGDEVPNLSQASTDTVNIPSHDWLTGFIVTSRALDEGELSERRHIVGLEVLFAKRLPIQLGLDDGDKRLIYVTEGRFIVALDIHRSSAGVLSAFAIVEQPLVHAYGCLRVADTRRGNYNMHVVAYLWRQELPQPSLRISSQIVDYWSSLSEVEVYAMDTLMLGTSEDELSDITSVSVDIRLGGFEVTYNGRPTRAIGPRLQAMKTLQVDGRGGERVRFVWVCVTRAMEPVSLQLITNRGRFLSVGESTETASFLGSLDGNTRLIPCGLYGSWQGSESQRYLAHFGVIGSAESRPFNERLPRFPRDAHGFLWEPSSMPPAWKETGLIWGGCAVPDSLEWLPDDQHIVNVPPEACTVSWLDCSHPLSEVRITLAHSTRGMIPQVPISAITMIYTDGSQKTVGPSRFSAEPTCGWCTPESSIDEEVRTVPHYRHQSWHVGGKKLTSMRIWRLQGKSMVAIQLVAEGHLESPIWGHWGHDVRDLAVGELRFAGHEGGDAVGLKFFFQNNGIKSRRDTIISGIQAVKSTVN